MAFLPRASPSTIAVLLYRRPISYQRGFPSLRLLSRAYSTSDASSSLPASTPSATPSSDLALRPRLQPLSNDSHHDPVSGTRGFLRKLSSEIDSGDVNGALTTYRRIMTHPQGRTRITHKIIRSLIRLVRQGEWGPHPVQTTLQLLEDLQNLLIPLDLHEFNLMLTSYISLQEDEAVRITLEKMREQGHQPDVTTYNLLLSDFAGRGNITAVRKGLEAMTHVGVKPDLVTFNTVLAALAGSMDRLDTAELARVLRAMEADHIQPDTITYNILIKAYLRAGDTEAGMATLSSMVQAGFPADVMTYRTIIAALLRNHDCTRAETHYHAMVQAGYRPPGWLLDRFVAASVECQDRDAAERWVQEIVDRGNKLSTAVKLSLVRLAASESDLSQLKMALEMRTADGLQHDDDRGTFYRVVVQEMLKKNALDLIPVAHDCLVDRGYPSDQIYEQAWRAMRARNSKSDAVTIDKYGAIALDNGRQTEKNDETAVLDINSVLNSTFEKTFIANIGIANRRIAALAKLPETLSEAFALFHTLPKLCLAPTCATFSPLLGALARIPDMDALLRFWSKMEQNGIQPDEGCYNSLISGWLRSGNPDQAAKALAGLNASGLIPNQYTTRLRIEVALATKQYEAAVDLVEEVCRNKVTGAYKTLNSTVATLCRDGRIDAAHRCWMASRDIVSHGKSANNTSRLIWYPSVAAMVLGHVQTGNVESALQVYRTGVSDGLSFETHVVLAMAKALHMDERPKDLHWVLLEAVKERITPSRANWSSVATLLKEYDGRMTSTILEQVIGHAPTKPSIKDVGNLIMARYQQRNGEEVELLCRVFIKHDVSFEAGLFKILFASRQMTWPAGALRHLLEYAIRSAERDGLKVDEQSVALALEGLIACEDGAGVSIAYDYMTKNGMVVHAAQRGRVVESLCRAGLTENAEKVVTQIADGWSDIGMLESLAVLYARQGLIAKLDSTLDRIADKAGARYAVYPRAIVEAVRDGHTATGLHLLQRMLANGETISHHNYVSLIAAMAQRGQVAEVMDVMCSLVAAGIFPDAIVYNLIIKAYIQAGRAREALQLLADPSKVAGGGILATIQVQPDAWAYNTVLAGLARDGDLESLQKIKKLMHKHHIEFDLSTYTALLPNTKTVDEVQEIHAAITRLQVEPDAHWFRNLAAAYARLKEPRLCEAAVRMCPDIGTREWNLILKGWTEVGEYWKCTRLYRRMVDVGYVRPEVATINTLISAALSSDQVASVAKEVDQWMAEMSRRNITPSIHTHNLLIRKAAMEKDARLVEDRWNAILRAGLQPNEATFVMMMGAYEGPQFLGKVSEIVDSLMPQYGIVPARWTYNSVMSIFAAAGQVAETREWMSKMEAAGIGLDDASWRYLVRAYISSEDLAGAEAALTDRITALQAERHVVSAVGKPIALSQNPVRALDDTIHLHHMLANAHCEDGRFPLALQILSRINLPAIDPVTLGTAMKICLLAGWHDDATRLWNWVVHAQCTHPSSEDTNDRLSFWTRRPRPRPLRALINEAFVASYIDSVARRIISEPRRMKLYGVPAHVKEAEHLRRKEQWQKNPHADLYKAWNDVLALKPLLTGNVIALPGDGVAAATTTPFPSFPTENMCNSFIEGLMLCKDYMGGIKTLSLMDAEDAAANTHQEDGAAIMAYPPRPTPKTVRIALRPLVQAGHTKMVGKVTAMIRTRWPDLGGCVDELLEPEKPSV
ncbi:hypothetical protein DFJ77DRAFT_467307, partial [Powellomyces hirtus]